MSVAAASLESVGMDQTALTAHACAPSSLTTPQWHLCRPMHTSSRRGTRSQCRGCRCPTNLADNLKSLNSQIFTSGPGELSAHLWQIVRLNPTHKPLSACAMFALMLAVGSAMAAARVALCQPRSAKWATSSPCGRLRKDRLHGCVAATGSGDFGMCFISARHMKLWRGNEEEQESVCICDYIAR